MKALGQSICTGAWNGCDVNQGGKTQMYTAMHCTFVHWTVYVHPKTLTQKARAYFTQTHGNINMHTDLKFQTTNEHSYTYRCTPGICQEEKSPDQPVGTENSFQQSKVACSSEGVKCPLWRDNLKFFKPM